MLIGRYLPHMGGAQIQAHRLAYALQVRGVAVKMLTRQERSLPTPAVIDGIPVQRLWLPPISVAALNALVMGWGIYRTVRRCAGEFDMLHVHQALYPALFGVLAAKTVGLPVVVKITSSDYRFDLKILAGQAGPIGHWAAKTLARDTAVFIAINESIAADLQKWDVPQSRIWRIPNGVDIPLQKGAASRDKLNLPADRLILLTVGSLRPQKNQAILIKALREVVEQGHNPLLLLLGDGDLRDSLQRQVTQLGLISYVRFCGWVDNVQDYLATADIFILPSLVEGLSNALMEAMAQGLPCIVSDVPGNRVLIQPGHNGLVFTNNDPADLGRAIVYLLEESAQRKYFGKQARQTIVADYTMEHIADRYLALYEELAANH